MLTDYELFLTGCYGAVVEIKNENELESFMNLMKELGFSKYVNWLSRLGTKDLMENAKYNGIKQVCFEYQMGKGFTFGDKQEYIDNCDETKILSLEDLIKSVRE